jgi:hypothetical protein
MMSKITWMLLNGQQAVKLIDRLLAQAQQPKLNDLQSTIVLETWDGHTYRSIADRLSYDLDYIKQIAARLWKSLSRLLGENICKGNIRSVLERCQEAMPRSSGENLSAKIEPDLQTIETWIVSDRCHAVAFLCSAENPKIPQSPKLDLQIQSEIESLIWSNLHQSVAPTVLINEILAVLTIRNLEKNAVNCLVVNCYFDRAC